MEELTIGDVPPLEWCCNVTLVRQTAAAISIKFSEYCVQAVVVLQEETTNLTQGRPVPGTGLGKLLQVLAMLADAAVGLVGYGAPGIGVFIHSLQVRVGNMEPIDKVL